MNVHVVHNIRAQGLLQKNGLEPDGRVQKFLVSECDRRMVDYLPYRSGAQIKNRYVVPDGIVFQGRYARFLYYGKVMVGVESGSPWARPKEIKRATDRPLQYDTTKNPLAGPLWDKRMWENHRDDIIRAVSERNGRRP